MDMMTNLLGVEVEFKMRNTQSTGVGKIVSTHVETQMFRGDTIMYTVMVTGKDWGELVECNCTEITIKRSKYNRKFHHRLLKTIEE